MVKIRARRSFGNPEHASDLPVRETFHVVQDDHRPLTLRELSEPGDQSASQLIVRCRIPHRKRHVLRKGVGVAHLAAATDVQRRVGHDPVQPGTECLLGAEAVERSVRVEESLLYRIFRVFVRRGYGTSDGVCSTLVKPYQRRERAIVAVLGGQHEIALALASASCRFSRQLEHVVGGMDS